MPQISMSYSDTSLVSELSDDWLSQPICLHALHLEIRVCSWEAYQYLFPYRYTDNKQVGHVHVFGKVVSPINTFLIATLRRDIILIAVT